MFGFELVFLEKIAVLRVGGRVGRRVGRLGGSYFVVGLLGFFGGFGGKVAYGNVVVFLSSRFLGVFKNI